MMKNTPFLTVSGVNRYLKTLLDENPGLHFLTIKGEVSNFKRYSSGHCYFTLKDETSRLSAVMFSKEADKLAFPVKDGDEVLATGSISIYPANGIYQLYVSEMSLFGLGKQLIELEKLKRKLAAEGLFDESRKRMLPLYPKAIGVISGKGSAAARDMFVNIHRRYPMTEIYFFPSLVQGEGAPEDLRRALTLAQTYPLDTIIIGRGGGANEDLSAFNDEGLVRDVAACRVPTISAVGHEVDVTLCDYAADKRASTPTGAAELAVPDVRDLLSKLMNSEERLINQIQETVKNLHKNIENSKNRPIFTDPSSMYREKITEVAHRKELLIRSIRSRLEEKTALARQATNQLTSLNPRSILNRGYSFTTDEQGKLITSIKEVVPASKMKTVLKDGTIVSTVEGKEERHHG